MRVCLVNNDFLRLRFCDTFASQTQMGTRVEQQAKQRWHHE